MRGERGKKETWRRIVDGEMEWASLRTRSAVLGKIREFFRERGFLEVDPPIAQRHPNIDPNIFPVKIAAADGTAEPFYLHTSPELSMKKLLAAGSGDIFFLGKVFRDREGSPLHSPEFTMLEWYRVNAGAGEVMGDIEDLVRWLARSIRGTAALRYGGREIPVDEPWARWELDDAFRELLGVGMADAPGLRRALASRGSRPGRDESWEDLFFRACLDVVEPALAERGGCFLTGYPAPLAAMARRRAESPDRSERFEGFVAGVELANGYEELTDPAEQEERLTALAVRHRQATGEVLPVDPGFLDALHHGLPPCSGAALGVDRLLLLLLGLDDIADGMYR